MNVDILCKDFKKKERECTLMRQFVLIALKQDCVKAFTYPALIIIW